MAVHARVTRQQVEILVFKSSGSTFNETPSTSLGLTQTVTTSDLVFRSASHSLGLNDLVGIDNLHVVSVHDTLAMADRATLLRQDIIHTLLVSDVAVGFMLTTPVVADTLALTDSATFMDERQVIVPPDVMTITDQVRQNFYDENITDPLTLVQDVDLRAPHYLQIHHRLFLTDVGRSIAKNVRVRDAIALVDFSGQEKDVSVADTIVLTDLAYVSYLGDDTLALTQTVQVGKGAILSHFMATLQQTVSTAGSQWNKSPADSLNLLQSAAYLINQPCTTRQYSPFITVTGDPVFTPPSPTAPVTSLGKLTLTFPFISPTTTFVMRNPEFGNREDFTVDTIARRTLGGSYIAFADPTWPKIKTMKMTVRLLKLADANTFRDFLRVSLGREIGLLDYESRQWRGIITNPDTAITQDDRVHYTIDLEFEGELA